MEDQDNLTSKQNDYAIFLPAISGFYATFIGKQRVNNDYVNVNRMPAAIQDMEQMNWLNDSKSCSFCSPQVSIFLLANTASANKLR